MLKSDFIQALHLIVSYRETENVCGIWYLLQESDIDWVFPVFNWVFVTFILGNTLLSLYFLYNINYFNWVSINYYAF